MTTTTPTTYTDSETEEARGKPLRLGRRLDLLVKRLREFSALLVGLPVAWVQLQPSIEALRVHKNRRIKSGINTILAIQRYRSRPLDVFFQLVSFFHEEDFYLLILPVLFWDWDYLLGVRLTTVVVAGLFVGNFIKDVYQLPRPSSAEVWRPTNQEKLDSTALQDFGFPSTHAMNSLTNSFVVAWHFHYLGESSPFSSSVPALACAAWIAVLCLSRIYLGAHTTTDVRGGLSLGLIMWVLVILFERDFVERRLIGVVAGGAGEAVTIVPPLFLSELAFNAVVLVFGTFSLLMLPQPRPPTPTFHQNSMLVGLGWGLLSGARLRYRYLGTTAAAAVRGTPSAPETAACLLAGFIFLALTRILVKALVTGLLKSVFRVRLSPTASSSVTPAGVRALPTARLFTRDVDILGVAIVKTLVYLALAFSITFVVPVMVIPTVRSAAAFSASAAL